MKYGMIIACCCVFLAGCAASVDPAMQARIAGAFSATSTKVYDADREFTQPMPFAVGQYVVLGLTDGEDRSMVRTSVVGKEGDAWVIETATTSPSGESAMQMAVQGLDRARESMNTDDIELKWVKIRSGDEVQTFDGALLSMMQGTYKKAVKGLVTEIATMPERSSVRVPAGTFNGCTKARSKVEGMFGSYETEGFYHPSVPLNGIVRATSTDDGSTIELLDFGLTGAKSTF